MAGSDYIAVRAQEANGRPGAVASFPFDRATVERFRQAFPKARWSDELRAWVVPGKTAERRLGRWLGREMPGVLGYADERGRDAFAFEPIESKYLTVGDGFQIRTPFSRTITAEMREVPWAAWDSESRLWRVPYRSWEDLRRRWPTIEAAARRNEPEERKRRREAERGSPERAAAAEQEQERRKHRYPVPTSAIPPLETVLMTGLGTVVFKGVTGEIIEDEVAKRHYPAVSSDHGPLIWATWRRPTLQELVETWPARSPPSDAERSRGWWTATRDELRAERRRARSIERAAETRARTHRSAESSPTE